MRTFKTAFDALENVGPDWLRQENREGLHALISHFPEKELKILEIGSFYGRSTAFFRTYFEDCIIHCVDLFKDYNPHTSNYDTALGFKDFSGEFKSNLQTLGLWDEQKVKVYQNNSQELLRLFPKNYFDLCYIDGDHSENSVKIDLLNSYEVCKPLGIICGDDYHLNTVRQGVAKGISEVGADSFSELKVNKSFYWLTKVK